MSSADSILSTLAMTAFIFSSTSPSSLSSPFSTTSTRPTLSTNLSVVASTAVLTSSIYTFAIQLSCTAITITKKQCLHHTFCPTSTSSTVSTGIESALSIGKYSIFCLSILAFRYFSLALRSVTFFLPKYICYHDRSTMLT
jgi:hypothetical protein